MTPEGQLPDVVGVGEVPGGSFVEVVQDGATAGVAEDAGGGVVVVTSGGDGGGLVLVVFAGDGGGLVVVVVVGGVVVVGAGGPGTGAACGVGGVRTVDATAAGGGLFVTIGRPPLPVVPGGTGPGAEGVGMAPVRYAAAHASTMAT